MNNFEARKFAEMAHGSQIHSKNRPYVMHLDDVVTVLTHFGITDDTMIQAGYLHDTLEDTQVTAEDVYRLFGPDVMTLVSAVTDEPGKNRTERKAKIYPKIKATPGATTLKLADRIANLERSILQQEPKFVMMYVREYPEFRAALYVDTEINRPLWEHLHNLVMGQGRMTDNCILKGR